LTRARGKRNSSAESTERLNRAPFDERLSRSGEGRFQVLLERADAAGVRECRADAAGEERAAAAKEEHAARGNAEAEGGDAAPPEHQTTAPLEPGREVSRVASAETRSAAGGGRVSAAEGSAAPVEKMQVLGNAMIRSASVEQLRGVTSVRLQLSTPSIRQVQFSVSLQHGRLHARFALPDAADYQLLSSASPELQASLRAKGIDCAAVEVVRGEAEAGTAQQRRNGSGGQGGQQRTHAFHELGSSATKTERAPRGPRTDSTRLYRGATDYTL
jgi:flagellar hook-length control protein FliK